MYNLHFYYKTTSCRRVGIHDICSKKTKLYLYFNICLLFLELNRVNWNE